MGKASLKSSECNFMEYEFADFVDREGLGISKDVMADDYSFGKLERCEYSNEMQKKKKLNFEKKKAKVNHFRISPIVKKYRGLDQREREELENKIQAEVEERVYQYREDAIESGRKEGRDLGKEEVYNQTRALTEEKLTALTEMINNVLKTQDEILSVQRKEIYQLIRNLTKWIILRELNEDGEYIKRLLEKLVTELQAKENILIQVNKSDFDNMPEVLEVIETKIGKMDNVRVEIDPDIPANGIIIESKNGIINGTLEEQFMTLDKLFLTVGLSDD